MFLLTLISLVTVTAAATCVSDSDKVDVTGQGTFNLTLSSSSSCTAGTLYVAFLCGKTLNFQQKIATTKAKSVTSPLQFSCSNFYRTTNDPNLICDFYQCMDKNNTKAVTVVYTSTTQSQKQLPALRADTQESKSLTLNITVPLEPPPEPEAKDSNLLTIIIVVAVAIIVLLIVFVVFCVLCNKRKTQAHIDEAKKVDAMYREHPKNDILADIIRRQKRYEDSENTDDFYRNTAETGDLMVASGRTRRSSRLSTSARSKANTTHRVESEDDSFSILSGKKNRSSRAFFHDESFTVNRVLKPATGDLNLTDSD